jgi:NAD-dependent dihydropyrimidine dehydrogenase PreA subunit
MELVNTCHIPIEYDQAVCTGCNRCVEACMNDVLAPNAVKGQAPQVVHPTECYYCGCCVMECPRKDKESIKLIWPMKINLQWKRKATGQLYRLGMANQPPPNLTPPVGGWEIILRRKRSS